MQHVLQVKLRGGAHLKILKVLSLAALLLFAVGIAQADTSNGGDTQVHLNGGPGHSSNFTGFSVQVTADSQGLISADFLNTSLTQYITSVTISVPNFETIGDGLTCTSDLFVNISYSVSNGIDSCTMTANPGDTTPMLLDEGLDLLTGQDPCSLADEIEDGGVPYGCDVQLGNDIVNGVPSAFVPGASLDLTGDGAAPIPLPTPESGTFSLLALGLAAAFLLGYRKLNLQPSRVDAV